MIKRACGLSLCLLLFIYINLSAQQTENALPLSITENLTAITKFEQMSSVDSIPANNLLNQPDTQKAWRFAIMFPVNLSPENSGLWQDTPNGKVWRVGIQSVNAYSLYLTLSKFFLNRRVKLFCYSPDYKHVRGAFTQHNNTTRNILSIAPVEGEKIVIELNVPTDVDHYGVMHIAKVYHDYRNEFGKRGAGLRTTRNTCDQSVNCDNGKYWQPEKRAVCRIISEGSLSTGTLVGNTTGDKTPYVVTSHHTMKSDTEAASAIFYFNYEYPYCGSDLLNEYQTIAGSSLVATADKLDFALLKLNRIPPASYQPYYAGWDVTHDAPQRGVCIHHASGGIKQIAIDYHPMTSSVYSEELEPGSSWRVAAWDVGTTQPGSSGSALFNEQHRVVGTLTGGSATCDAPVNDYFSKLAMAWQNYPDIKNQLKVWLDPINRNVSYIDGYDPYGFEVSNCDTAWNNGNYSDAMVRTTTLDWGWISGHNASRITQFAEKFVSPASLQLPGIFLNVAKAYAAQPLSYIKLKVWEGDATPLNEKYSKIIFIKNLIAHNVNYIPFDSLVKLNGNFFVGYELNYENPLDSVAVYTSSTATATSAYVYSGTWQSLDESLDLKEPVSLAIGILECYGKVRKPEARVIRTHPNPATNHLVLDIPSNLIVYDMECFDSGGRKVPIGFVAGEENNKVYFNLSPGLYILKIVTKESQFFSKFIVAEN